MKNRPFLLSLFLLLPALALAGEKILLRAARLIDGKGGVIAPALVLIDGERIADVGSVLPVAAGVRVIDLGRATLLPGLIDLHTHLCGHYGTHWEDELIKTTPAYSALWGARNARVKIGRAHV